jgi:hypothetical protein
MDENEEVSVFHEVAEGYAQMNITNFVVMKRSNPILLFVLREWFSQLCMYVENLKKENDIGGTGRYQI